MGDRADSSQRGIGLLHLERHAIRTRDADTDIAVGVEATDKRLVDLADEDHLHGFHRLIVGDTEPTLELHRDIELLQEGIDGLAATMHEHDSQSHELHEHEVAHDLAHEVCILHRSAAVLHDDRAAVHLVDPGQGLGQDLCFLCGFASALALFCLH